MCTDNITDVSSKDDQSDSAQFVNSVDSFICQSTIIPADGRGFRMAISSQSISLADTFIGVALVQHRLAVLRRSGDGDAFFFISPQVQQWTRHWMAWRPNQIFFRKAPRTFRTSTSTTGALCKDSPGQRVCRDGALTCEPFQVEAGDGLLRAGSQFGHHRPLRPREIGARRAVGAQVAADTHL